MPVDSFFGRRAELERFAHAFSTERLVSVVGLGGIGKTRLVREALARTKRPPALSFISLESARDERDLGHALGTALRIPAQPGVSNDDRLAQALHALAHRDATVLVLDGAEGAIESVASFVHDALAAAPGVRFVVTSRERLRITGEWVIELGPLGSEGAGDDALELFFARAERARGAKLDPIHREDVSAIVRDLDGIPLAIELAAARTSVLTPAELRARLSRRFEILVRGPRAVPERHRSLRATLDASFELLEADEQWALARLSVFRGGFDLPAASAVLGGRDAALVVESLRERSWLFESTRTGEHTRRFDAYETVRSYAAEKLAESPHAREVELLHARHFAGESRGWRGERASSERDNVRAMLDRALADLDDRERALAALEILVLTSKLSVSEPADATLAMLDALFASARPESHPSLEARARLERARLLRMRGELDRAREEIDRALALAETNGDVALAVEVLGAAGGFHYLRGDTLEAQTSFEQGLALWDASGLGDPLPILTGLALLHHIRGELDPALARYTRVLAQARARGESAAEASTLARLGFLRLDRGEVDDAEELLERALAIHRALANRHGEGITLGYLGNVARHRRQTQRARSLYDEAIALLRSVGDHQFAPVFAMDRGILELDSGELALAERAFDDALALLRPAPNVRIEALCYAHRAAILAHHDRIDAARAMLADARALVAGDDLIIAVLEVQSGHLDLAEARRTHAPASIERARELARTEGLGHVKMATRILARALERDAPVEGTLIVVGEEVSVEGRGAIALGGRPVLAAIFHALADARDAGPEPVSLARLAERAWPDEHIDARARANRIRVAVNTLRKLGVPGIETHGGGYRLDPAQPFVRRDPS